jgi:hypothetical protein
MYKTWAEARAEGLLDVMAAVIAELTASKLIRAKIWLSRSGTSR